MASHGINWVPSAHLRFGDLDFIIMVEGELVRAPVVIQPFHSTSLNTVTKMLKELWLHAPEARASGSGQLLDFDYGRLERQLSIFREPNHPGRTYATSPSCLPMSWRSLLGESHSP